MDFRKDWLEQDRRKVLADADVPLHRVKRPVVRFCTTGGAVCPRRIGGPWRAVWRGLAQAGEGGGDGALCVATGLRRIALLPAPQRVVRDEPDNLAAV